MNSDLKSKIEQSAKRIASSDTIAVVLPEILIAEIIGSAAALVSGLKAIGKTVTLFSPPSPAANGMLMEYAGEENEPLREFIISFDLTRSPIKELKYERDQKRLNIILSPTGQCIQRSDIEFRHGASRYDLVIALGSPRPEAAMASVSRVPELLHEKPILNIDANPANTGYGEINLVPANDENSETSLPELIHAVLKTLNVPLDDPERMNAIFFALAAATKEFQPKNSNAGAFLLAGELLSLGAQPTTFHELPAERTLAEDQLAARAIARSRFKKETGMLWSLITREDFEKTGTKEGIAYEVMERITNGFPYAARHVLLWQGPDDEMVRGLLACQNTETAQKINRLFAPVAKNMWQATNHPFPSFSAAEKHIAELLLGIDTGYN